MEPGFMSLFNGKVLTGWIGNPKLWSVEDRAITGRTGEAPHNKLTHNTYLVYTGGSVDDFELRLKYRIEKGNSGIQHRSKVLGEGNSEQFLGHTKLTLKLVKSIQELDTNKKGRAILALRGQATKLVSNPENPKKPIVQVLGSLCDTEDIQGVIKSEDWNDYTIIANGNQLTYIIKGRVTVSVVDEDQSGSAKSSVLALQIHVVPAMVFKFKDIQLREIN